LEVAFKTSIDSVCKSKCWCRCMGNEMKIILVTYTVLAIIFALSRRMNQWWLSFLVLLFYTFTMGFELDW